MLLVMILHLTLSNWSPFHSNSIIFFSSLTSLKSFPLIEILIRRESKVSVIFPTYVSYFIHTR